MTAQPNDVISPPPEIVAEPQLPPGHTLTRPRQDELPELLALVRACDEAALGYPDFSADDVQEWLDAPHTRPDADGWVVRDATGALVGWGYVESRYGGDQETGAVYVHPTSDDRLYALLVEHVRARTSERGAEAGRERTRLEFWATRSEHQLVDAVTRAGAVASRTFARMRRSLEGFQPAVALPPGMTIHGIDPADEAAMRTFHDVYERSFANHYGHETAPYEAWRARLAAMPSVPYDEWLVAELDGVVVGAMQAADMSDDDEGWVRNIGVLPEARGRGVARALLDRAFATWAGKGYAWAGLGVDTSNATGAYGLYESVDMHVRYVADLYALEVPSLAR